MGARLSEDEVQRALDFCVHLFSPTTPEQHESVRRKLLASQCMLEEDDEIEEESSADLPIDHERVHNPSTEPKGHGGSVVDRLMDVRAPIVDPTALARLLRSKLSLFRRNSSASIASAATSASSISTPFTPSSPVSDVFSSSARSFSSASDVASGEGAGAGDEGGDEEMRMVLEKVNARRVIHAEHGEGLNSLEQESVGGLVVRLERGCLGLMCVSADDEGQEAGP